MSHILLVEDNQNNADIVIRLLESEGYTVKHYLNGLEGMRAARTERPQMILMDFNLPDIDGRNVVLVLKKQLGGASAPPIIAVTAKSGDMEERYARRMGCDAFVSKPIDPEAFLKLVNHYLKPSGDNDETTAEQQV
jgi:two-component system, cell cycle response regulator DivK